MTQEEKQLLVIDLCARLPFDVEAQVFNKIEGESKPFVVNKPITFDDIDAFVKNDVVIDIKPYLRPMSSMTEEETNHYHNFFPMLPRDLITPGNSVKLLNWLNANHFDYRGLIPMGLAIETPEGMYSKQ